VFELPVGPQLRVAEQEVVDGLLELGLERLELVDEFRGVLRVNPTAMARSGH
jgi:hypothetical protein